METQGHLLTALLMDRRLVANITRCFFWLGYVGTLLNMKFYLSALCRNHFEIALLVQSVLMILAQVGVFHLLLFWDLNKRPYPYSLLSCIFALFIDLVSVQKPSSAPWGPSPSGNGQPIHSTSSFWLRSCTDLLTWLLFELTTVSVYVIQLHFWYLVAPIFLLAF